MKIFKTIILILLLTEMHAQGVTWHKLKALKAYPGSAYKLKKGVEYLEIRSYHKGMQEKKYNIKKYTVAASMYKKPLNSFPSGMVKRFKKLKPNLSKKTNIKKVSACLMRGCVSSIGNGFMIDSQKKIWIMNTTEDVTGMLGEIDTPAEVKLILWLKDESRDTSDQNHKDKYRKTSRGYTVISEYDNSIMNFGECGHFTYRMTINKKGKITSKKLLKKGPSKYGCLAAD